VAAKTRVLHIIKSLGRGGAEMLLLETLKSHRKDKFEFHYIYFLPWKNQLEAELIQHGGRVTCVPASNNLKILFKARWIEKYVKANNIQLVHCHLPWAGFVGRLVYKLTAIPVIYTEHNKQERYHFITKILNKLTFNWQQIAIAVSADVATSIQQNISPKIKVLNITNGVSTDSFQRDESAGAEIRNQVGIKTGVIVGTVAVFRFQKRLQEWLEIFARVSSRHPGLYGIIVGDGPLKEELLATRRKLGLENKVFMPGLQTDVKPWVSAMDIFMMTSVFEGLPVALLEAMSMKCAILTTDAGGIKEIIRHNENGIMVSVNQLETMEVLLEELMQDRQRLQTLADAARISIQQAFGIDKMVAQLEELYDQTKYNGGFRVAETETIAAA
jgi:glycosyltransferase involved in cell wall biosynthesis